MRDFTLSLLCVAITLLIYYLNKRLYRRWRTLLLMPLVMTPLVLVALLLVTHISWQDYIAENHCCCGCWGPLRWLLPCRCMKTSRLLSVTGCR